jgi:EAL domain-containing protein (putative c-di-GMP-specific phosphodiesterase class I)
LIDGDPLTVSASVGISLSTVGISAADLLRNADVAMYHAKMSDTSRPALFNDEMQDRITDRRTRESDLRQAVANVLLGVNYQPIVELSSGRIYGVEALVRWPETWTPVTPGDFIPIAEQIGLIGQLGQYVLQTALETLAEWRRTGLVEPDVRMSVNFSAHQLADPTLAQSLLDALADAGVPPSVLMLDLTESTLMQDRTRAKAIAADITDIGIGLHLDDYGTGRSSISALHHCHLDALKIDRSFVAAMNEAADSSDVIVRSAVSLAHSLGIAVVAEGVEDFSQLRRLIGFECDYGQGYLFSKPLPRHQIETFIAGWPSRWATSVGNNALELPPAENRLR